MFVADFADNPDFSWCPICRSHKDGHCDGPCGRKFLPAERRYRSQSHHLHPFVNEFGKDGARAINQEFCVDCYRKDYAIVFPNAEQPDLPDRGIDPKFHAAQRQARRIEEIQKIINRLKSQKDKQVLQKFLDVAGRYL